MPERLEEILEAAAAIFREKGYESASTEEIAQSVGLLKGSLYYYIDSKEDLLYHVVSQVHRRLADGVQEACLEAGGDALVRLRIFLERHFAIVADNLEGAAVFYHDFRSLSTTRRADLITVRDEYEVFLQRLLMDGQQAGSVCCDLDPKLTTIGILSVLNSIHLWYRADGGRDPHAMGALYADFLLGGLQCSPALHHPGHRSVYGVPGQQIVV